jgi:hypothetical protein
MAKLKGTEKVVAENLKFYFAKENCSAFFEEGDDPPDIYLNIDGKKISVEITDIDQNVLKSRKTIDYGYLKFIENLDKELGHLIEGDKKISLIFYHNYHKVSAISKKLKKYLKSIIEENKYETNSNIEDIINGVSFKISTLKIPKNGKRKIVGGVMPDGGKVKKSRDVNTVLEKISDSNLTEQTLAIIQERISNKNTKCEGIEKPVWLAFYDNYYNNFTYFDNTEHLEHYKDVFKSIYNFGCFEKILVVFKNGDVLDFNT